MPIPANIAQFWDSFCATAGGVDNSRFYEAFHFGDNEPQANSLASLVLDGRKRATAGAVWVFEAKGQRLPRPGDLSVVTDYSCNPLCVIETIQVDVLPFDQVGAEFAETEGEGDGSLAYWQRSHAACFSRECARHGRQFAPDMLVSCERFRVVFQIPPACPPWPAAVRTIRVGGMSKGVLLDKLIAAEIHLNEAGRALFADHRFTTSESSSLVETIEVSVAGLGCPGGATLPVIFEQAAEQGLSLCPLELGPYLRLQFLDQPEGSMGFPPSKHRAPPGSITVASRPLSEDVATPVGFYQRRINGVLWLRGHFCNPDHLWNPEDRLVFCRATNAGLSLRSIQTLRC